MDQLQTVQRKKMTTQRFWGEDEMHERSLAESNAHIKMPPLPKAFQKYLDQRESPAMVAYELMASHNEILQALKEMVAANDGVAVMPTEEARAQNAALTKAKQAIHKAAQIKWEIKLK